MLEARAHRQLKALLDPNGILNPYKVLPASTAVSWGLGDGGDARTEGRMHVGGCTVPGPRPYGGAAPARGCAVGVGV